MAEPFKNQVGPAAVERIGAAVGSVMPGFDHTGFAAEAIQGLLALELKGRVDHVARVLRRHLPERWPEAAQVLATALPAPIQGTSGFEHAFWAWPMVTVVEHHAADPAISLPLLRTMTSRWSAEFAVRPYLDGAPDESWRAAAAWAHDADVHVRRLASEGTRPRLPWGVRLRSWTPARALPILDALVLDSELYVRRSVANHLGDIGKVDPALAREVAARWWAIGREEAQWVVKHGLRDLARKGDEGALGILGAAGSDASVTGLRIEPAVVRVGDPIIVRGEIRSPSGGAVRVDLRWEWPGARGQWAGKTFRGADRPLAPGELWAFQSSLSTKPVTTRPTRPGPQRLWLRVGGKDHGPCPWVLEP